VVASCGRWTSPPAESTSEPGGAPSGGAADPQTAGEAGAVPRGEGGAATASHGGEGGESGTPHSAGEGGSGAQTTTGGVTGSGGRMVPTGEAGGAGRGGAATGGAAPLGPCAFSIDAAPSPVIGTVGIVTWSVTMDTLESAVIEFGLDDGYGATRRVDLDEPDHRTLLVGMKPSRDYHYRIRASGGGETCTSADQLLTTEPLPNGLPTLEVETRLPDALAGGYVLSSFLSRSPAFILDADGDYVWAFGSSDVGRAQLSADGKYVWYTAINVRGGMPSFRRVTLDGLDDRAFEEFGDAHHDFTVLPDGTVGFIQHDGSCDRIMERAPDGSVREVIDVHDAHGGVSMCHTNSLHFHAEDATFTFSDLNQNAYVKVTRSGEVQWVLGGTTSDFTGDGAEWSREHGHDLIAADRLLFFNNEKPPAPSVAVEVSLDLTSMTATRVWEHSAGLNTPIYGDAQRLHNGNTLVTYGVAGVIEEVTANHEVARTLRFGLGGALGYSTHLRSLDVPEPEE
jgi:hypothetical protein